MATSIVLALIYFSLLGPRFYFCINIQYLFVQLRIKILFFIAWIVSASFFLFFFFSCNRSKWWVFSLWLERLLRPKKSSNFFIILIFIWEALVNIYFGEEILSKYKLDYWRKERGKSCKELFLAPHNRASLFSFWFQQLTSFFFWIISHSSTSSFPHYYYYYFNFCLYLTLLTQVLQFNIG